MRSEAVCPPPFRPSSLRLRLLLLGKSHRTGAQTDGLNHPRKRPRRSRSLTIADRAGSATRTPPARRPAQTGPGPLLTAPAPNLALAPPADPGGVLSG